MSISRNKYGLRLLRVMVFPMSFLRKSLASGSGSSWIPAPLLRVQRGNTARQCSRADGGSRVGRA